MVRTRTNRTIGGSYLIKSFFLYEYNQLLCAAGEKEWDALLPFSDPSQVGEGVFSSNPAQFIDNNLNLVLFTASGILITLDGATGVPKWQWPIPPNISLTSVSGWDNSLGLLLKGQPIRSPYFPTVTRPTLMGCLDAVTGELRWLKNATDIQPLTQAEKATYAVERIEASKDGLLYTRTNKMLLIDYDTGEIIWKTQISLEGSVGTGQGANITHMSYIPSDVLSNGPDRLLLNANNWGFQRFVLMQFDPSNSSCMSITAV